LPAADLLLAPGAISVHRSGLETAFFQPALDLVFGEADVRFNPQMRYESAHTIKNAMICGQDTHRRRRHARTGPRSLMTLELYVTVRNRVDTAVLLGAEDHAQRAAARKGGGSFF